MVAQRQIRSSSDVGPLLTPGIPTLDFGRKAMGFSRVAVGVDDDKIVLLSKHTPVKDGSSTELSDQVYYGWLSTGQHEWRKVVNAVTLQCSIAPQLCIYSRAFTDDVLYIVFAKASFLVKTANEIIRRCGRHDFFPEGIKEGTIVVNR
jgi:hypothetical protein